MSLQTDQRTGERTGGESPDEGPAAIAGPDPGSPDGTPADCTSSRNLGSDPDGASGTLQLPPARVPGGPGGPATAEAGRAPAAEARLAAFPGLRQLEQEVRARDRRRAAARRDAESLFERLTAAPPDSRAELLASDPCFLSPALAERLLEAAGAAVRNVPAAALELCDLASGLLARLSADPNLVAEVLLLRPIVNLRRAEALWSAGEPCGAGGIRGAHGASAALDAAREDLDAVPLDAAAHALYCRVAALLGAGEGRTDEALALLGRAGRLYHAQGETAELAACLVARGWLLLDHDPGAALPRFQRAVALLGEAARDWTAVRARQGVALCQAELGLREKAEAGRREVRAFAAALPDPTDRLRCSWTDAQLAASLGLAEETEEAMVALPRIVEGWLKRGEGVLAALAVVDLAEVFLQEGRGQAMAGLASLEPRLRVAGLAGSSALALRAVLALAAHEPDSAGRPLLHLRAHLARSRGRPEQAYVPCRGATGTAAWDALEAGERRAICQRAGVSPVTADLAADKLDAEVRRLLAWAHQEATGVALTWGEGADLQDLYPRLRRLAADLRAAEAELHLLADRIPLPSDTEVKQWLAGERALSPAEILTGVLDRTLSDHLEPAIRDLEDAARGDDPFRSPRPPAGS